MSNPNQVFKDRELTGKDLTRITQYQTAAILSLLYNKNLNYEGLLIEALGLAPFDKLIPISDLTYHQAVKIILTANRNDLPDAIVVVDA